MNSQLVITHPGTAHFDEVTAISLLLAAYPDTEFRIERREPLQDEINNPEIWVIDTGEHYEPEKKNFDHHQSLNCPASFVLVAKYLGWLETLSIFIWWDFKDSVDRFGSTKAAEEFNGGDDMVNRNPMEYWLVDRFAADPQTAIPLLRSFGTYLIRDAEKLKQRIDYWKSRPRVSISGVTAMIGETEESAGLDEFRRLVDNPPDIVISKDQRGNGWRLFRYEGAPVDFTRIANHPDIAFAHKTGFLAKTKTYLPVDKLVALISQAVIH